MHGSGRTYAPPCGGWCEVCMLVVADRYIPPFGGWYEVCMLAEEHTYIRPFGAGVRYVC